MSLDLEPAELLAAALTAMTLALPLVLVLAAAAISGPPRLWNGAGLAMGTGLLLGVGLAAGAVLAGADGLIGAGLLLARIALVIGLVLAILAAVLVIVLEEGTALTAAAGILACGFIALGAPSEALPALQDITDSPLVLLAAVVIEAVALVALVGAAVAAAGHGRALQYGIAAAGAVGAVLSLYGILASATEALPAPSLMTVLITVLIALALGSIAGGVVETLRARRPAPAAPRTTST